MNARDFFADLKGRNVRKVTLVTWLEEQNRGHQIGWGITAVVN
jgi:hypothetical protein